MQVLSAGYDGENFAQIKVNDVTVEMEANQENIESDNDRHLRGLHICVIDPKTGEIEKAQVFDTYTSSAIFEEFIDENSIPDGKIVAAACQDDCTKNLSTKVKKWF